MSECQICFETFQTNQIDKVACGSSIDHMICFACEEAWRNKMPLRQGVRIMNCPTCRQPEKYRTVESLQREARTEQRTQTRTQQRTQTRTRTQPQRAQCASGRNCRSTSLSGRSMTQLKCTQCNIIFCCRTCQQCLGCRPFPSYMLPYIERLRL
jgi:hypothetical protein